MRKFLMNMVSDGSEVSVKRVITFAAFMVFTILLTVDCFFKIDIDARLYDILEWTILGGMGGTVLEKFSKKSQPVPPTQ
jgi:hypothetical protein